MGHAIPAAPDLMSQVSAIERHLAALDAALVAQDSRAVEAGSADLHRALVEALAQFRQAAQAGQDPLTPQLRQKLVLAQLRVAGQQRTAARAMGSIERTLKVLLPQEAETTYSALAQRPWVAAGQPATPSTMI